MHQIADSSNLRVTLFLLTTHATAHASTQSRRTATLTSDRAPSRTSRALVFSSSLAISYYCTTQAGKARLSVTCCNAASELVARPHTSFSSRTFSMVLDASSFFYSPCRPSHKLKKVVEGSDTWVRSTFIAAPTSLLFLFTSPFFCSRSYRATTKAPQSVERMQTSARRAAKQYQRGTPHRCQ